MFKETVTQWKSLTRLHRICTLDQKWVRAMFDFFGFLAVLMRKWRWKKKAQFHFPRGPNSFSMIKMWRWKTKLGPLENEFGPFFHFEVKFFWGCRGNFKKLKTYSHPIFGLVSKNQKIEKNFFCVTVSLKVWVIKLLGR